MNMLGGVSVAMLLAAGSADLLYINLELVPRLHAADPSIGTIDTVTIDTVGQNAAVGAADLPERPSSHPVGRSPKSGVELPKAVDIPVVVAAGRLETGDLVVEDELPVSDLKFNTACWSLTRAVEIDLNRMARKLRKDPGLGLRINGHADGVGLEDDNYRLGRRRAKRVARYLRERGISRHRISIASFGETKPLVKGFNRDALATNRRVELHAVQLSSR